MCDDIKITAGAINRSVTYVRRYSPLTLSSEWSETGRLVFLVTFSTIGILMNGFFISAFFVEPGLRKARNVFLGCAGLADYIIAGVVVPVCAVVLLSREWDLEPVCNVLQFIAEFSTYIYNLSFMMVSIENVYASYDDQRSKRFFRRNKVGVIAVMIFSISFVMAGVGISLELDYNYCTRAHFGNIYFRGGTAIIFQIVPFMITMVNLIVACVLIRRKTRGNSQRKRSDAMSCDEEYCLQSINLFSYGFFVSGWAPYLTIVYNEPKSCDAVFYHCAWIGLARSGLTSFLYALLSSKFRTAFVQIFNYCFCKKPLYTNYSSRHRRALYCRPMISNVRVHILQQAIDRNGSSRFSTMPREIRQL